MRESEEQQSDDGPALEPFLPLGDYAWPSTPIDRGVKRFVETLRKRFGAEDEDEGIDLSRLEATERSVLDDIVAPPANEPLTAELNQMLAAWCAADPTSLDEPMANLQVVVLPPCDDENFLRSWAESRGFECLASPPRDAFDQPVDLSSIASAATGVIVVPRLEEWFLRHDDDLVAVRDLLEQVDVSSQRWVIGCNSWAWQFLVASCSIDDVLPAPRVPAAFDAERLRHWLGRLAEGDGVRRWQFRSARSGHDAFSDTREMDRRARGTMAELAERSLGIPWVAWHQWRASLRTSSQTDADETAGLEVDSAEDEADADVAIGADVTVQADGWGGPASGDRETLWVAELRDFALPDRSDQQALLVLHALLIHGRLSEAEIRRTVPLPGHSHVTSALVNAGLVCREDGFHSCVPAAYPAIRDGLNVAGYPMDVL